MAVSTTIDASAAVYETDVSRALARAVAAQLNGLQVSALTLDEQTRDGPPQIIISWLCA
jgi:hypothetical protein